jgi:predicted Rdx family selenoprotein
MRLRYFSAATLLILVSISTLALPVRTPSMAMASSLPCQFVLGFRTIADALPETVGSCLENVRYNPNNGDALQQTTGGLLVWRKADNNTAFTDGYRTWVNGPNGIEQRLNTERFSWEREPPPSPVVVAPTQIPTPIPAAPPQLTYDFCLRNNDNTVTPDVAYSCIKLIVKTRLQTGEYQQIPQRWSAGWIGIAWVTGTNSAIVYLPNGNVGVLRTDGPCDLLPRSVGRITPIIFPGLPNVYAIIGPPEFSLSCKVLSIGQIP